MRLLLEKGVKIDSIIKKFSITETKMNELIEAAKIENQQIIEKMRLDSGLIGNYFARMNDTNRNLIDDNVEIEMEEMRGEQKEKEREHEAREAEKERKYQATESKKDRASKEKIAAKKPVAQK